MQKLLMAILILTASLSGMQQPPTRVYNAQNTSMLTELMQRNNIFVLPILEAQQLILTGADPDVTAPDHGFGITLLTASFLNDDFAEKHEEFICFLLDHNADPNKWRYTGPLHNACANGQILVVRKLIEKNAKVTAKTSKGISPLKNAVEGNFPGIVQILLENGAADDIDFLDAYGDTPISVAKEKKLQKIIQLFERYQNKSLC